MGPTSQELLARAWDARGLEVSTGSGVMDQGPLTPCYRYVRGGFQNSTSTRSGVKVGAPGVNHQIGKWLGPYSRNVKVY